jgi:hypothetical protein
MLTKSGHGLAASERGFTLPGANRTDVTPIIQIDDGLL